ncbi:MAG TPA: hypothetical protein VEF06_16025 [Bryobacteraceae bacterium]|nr:hypothetical protein [Bryobacteraceae bacterium]
MADALADIEARCDAIEGCFEYNLAWAAKGVSGDEPGLSTTELRHHLIGAVDAIQGLGQSFRTAVEQAGLKPAVRYTDFISILERDAKDALVTIELVLAQPVISSQLIDNLNASLHLRALLTDLFLIDELIKAHTKAEAQAAH